MNNDTEIIIDQELEEAEDELLLVNVYKLHRFALEDIFEVGNQQLIKQNVLASRQRRKKRLGRVSNYFVYVHSHVNVHLSNTMKSIESLSTYNSDESSIVVPTFRSKYNDMIN